MAEAAGFAQYLPVLPWRNSMLNGQSTTGVCACDEDEAGLLLDVGVSTRAVTAMVAASGPAEAEVEAPTSTAAGGVSVLVRLRLLL